MVLVLCLTLLPTAAFAEGEDMSLSSGETGGSSTGGEGGSALVTPGSLTGGEGGSTLVTPGSSTGGEGGGVLGTPGSSTGGEGGGVLGTPGSSTGEDGGVNNSEDTLTEIWCKMKPSSIQRGYDGTTSGSTIPINLTFTDGTNEIKLTEGTGFTAKKTFDSADAGWHIVTVEIELIGDAAAKYKLKAGEETFTIQGHIDKAHPNLTVSLSKAACTVGEKLLPLLSVSGAPEGAAVTYYYTPLDSGYLEFEGSEAVPAIDENTAISDPGTYYVYAKTSQTQNYEEERSATVALTVTEPAAASVTKADGTVSGTYKSLPAALNAAQNGDTVKLLANHTTNWSDVEAGEYATLAVVKKTLTLDLNGMTVDYLTVGDEVPDEAGGILDSYDGNLTVVDNIQGGSCGKIKNLEFVKGSLAIQGGRIGGSLTCNGNSGTVIISGGTVCNATVGDGATVTVTGGTGHAGGWYNDGTLNITDGTFGNVTFHNNGGTIAISGGTFGTITNTNGSGPIPLMPLLADNYAFYQGDHAQDSTEKTLTNVTVRPHTHSFENGKCDCGVAAIVVDNNNSFYNTLQAALDAAANNASITSVTLGQDLTENVTFNRSAAGALTLNMSGHKLEATAGVPLTVIGGELIIEGAGQINQNTASNATAFPAIWLTGGKLVITGDLTAQGGYDSSSSGRKPAIYATDGELDLQGNVSLNGGLTITGTAKLTNPLTQGTFYVDASETGNAIAITDSEVPGGEVYKKVLELLAKDYAFYRADGSLADAGGPKLRTGTYTIKSHTCSYTHNETNGMAFCNCGRSHAHRALSEEPSVLVNGICPICGYHCPHKNIGNDGVCTGCHAKMVAKVTVGETTTYTADLADALNKAANGTTITLLADTEISAYVNIYDETATDADQMVVTLDLAGHTVTSGEPIVIGADRNGAASHYGTLKIVGTGNITLDYVTLDTREKGVLDLTGWTGGSISSVTVTRIGNKNEGKLIVGKDAGHIGRLAFALVNCPPAEITNTKLYGGSYDEIITIGSGTLSLAGLLPNGCAFKNADGSFAKATESNLFNVTVSACDHGGAEGFDKSATACPYCNAPAVAETALNNGEGGMLWRRFANLQTAIDADRDGSAEFRLLTDVTGDYTIDGTRHTGLDLNGHYINGTVTVKGIQGGYITTTLSNTQNTTTASIDKVVAYSGAKLGGSGYPAVIRELTLAEGATWKNILNGTELGYKVLNADGTYKWYAPDEVNGSQLKNVIINRLPIPAKTLNLKVNGKNLPGSSPKVERGTIVQLCAYCNTKDADVSIYIGESDGNNNPTYSYSMKEAEYRQINKNWYYVVDLDASTIGTYDIYFTATKDGYSVMSSHKKLIVTKPDLRNAQITFRSSNESTYEPYNATTTAPGFTVTYNGKTLKLGVDYTASGTASSAGVSTQTLTIKAVEGSDYTGSKTAEWRIVPHKAKVEVGDVIKAYDGTTDLPDGKISLVSAAGSAGYQAGLPLPLSEGNGFELTDAKYDSANASETEKNISFTVKLTDTNYTFEDGTKEKAFTLKGSETDKTFKINPATIDLSHNRFEQTVFNDLAKTYEINLKQFLDKILPEGGTYGDIQYGQPSVSMDSAYYTVGGANIENGELRLSINKAASFKQGDEIGTVAVVVETTNYQPFTLTIHVTVRDRITPVKSDDFKISATGIIYRQTLENSTLTVEGTMVDPTTREVVKGTFAWKNQYDRPIQTGDVYFDWTFTPAEGYEEYASVTDIVKVPVAPKSIEGATITLESADLEYNAAEQSPKITGVTLENWDETKITYVIKSGDKATGVNDSLTLTIEGTGNYTGQATVQWKITPKKVTPAVEVASCTYTGDALEPAVTLKDGAVVIPAEEYTVAYSNNTNAGVGQVTITNKDGGNYIIQGSTQDFTIDKATAPTNIPTGTLNIINGTQQTYTYDFSKLLPELSEGQYGTISYGNPPAISLVSQSGYYYDATIVEFKNGVLTLAQFYAKDGTMTGQIGTVKVNVTTTNYKDFQLTLVLNAINKIKPTPDGTITASEITYGQTLSESRISGTMKDPDTGKSVNGTFAWTDGTIKPAANDSYEAEWTFTPAAGYEEYATATGTVTIKVNKATPTFTAPTAQENLTYTGQKQALITAGMTDDGTMQYSLTENGTYSQDSPVGTDAGAYTVWYRVIGDANHNDTAPASVAVRIGKKPLRITWVTAASKHYDGTTDAGITSVTFDGVNLNRGTDYTVTANFDDASVGNNKMVTATVTLMGQAAKNYALEQSSFMTTGSIIKAAAPDFTKETALTIVNGHEKTYTVTLPALPTLETPKEYGALTYEIGEIKLNDGYYTSGAKVENGELTLPIQKNDVETTGSVGTVTVVIKSANYEDITLTVNVSAKNRPTPVLSGELTLAPATITYGDPLSKIKITGTMKVGDRVVEGTFSWQQPDTVLDASDLGHDMGWRFTPEDENAYAEATGSAMVKVDKATQYGKLSMTGYAYGGTPSTPTLTDRTGDPNAQVRYTYSTTDSGLVQTWDIQNPPALNAGTYRMFARIGQTSNYYEYDVGYCEFVVAKATPTYTKPTGLTAKYGQTLADVMLPRGWSWMDSSESVGDASNAPKTFRAKFTPTDTENYNTVENIALEVAVNKADQAALTIQGADSVVYGQTLTLTATGGTGTGAVTYRMDTANSTGKATIDPNTGVLTPVKVGSVSVIATKAGNKDYNDVTSAAFVLMIKPATPTGEPKYTQITASDKTLKDAALTIEGSTLQPHDGKLEWVDEEGNVLPDSTWVEVNTAYQWRFTPTDTNYTTLTGKIMLYRYYTIEATAGIGGTISPSGNVGICGGEDQTFTITPNKGYAISNVRIDGKSIGAVKSYTFENVSRDHTIHVIFMKANGNPQTGVFVDEATGRYYEDTVD